MEYNWYLLNEREKSSQQATSKQELLTLLKSMTEAEREELLASIEKSAAWAEKLKEYFAYSYRIVIFAYEILSIIPTNEC